ncbi:MAG: hypothetical protein LLG37_07475 [Spirochaetia bacterium]|nr:hypothetical protein [Spirochaetia bacterium]
MKRLLLAVVAAGIILAAAGCGNVTVYDPILLEKPTGNTVDNAMYGFELEGTTVWDYGLSIYGDDTGYQDHSISADRAYAAAHSVKVSVLFDTPNGDSVLLCKKNASADTDIRGKTISAAVWSPYGMFDDKTAYGITFYAIYIYVDELSVKHYNWCQSAWNNMSAAPAVADGLWTFVSASTSTFTDTTTGLPMTDTAMLNVCEWGVKVGQGGESKNYTGFIYIDSLDIR